MEIKITGKVRPTGNSSIMFIIPMVIRRIIGWNGLENIDIELHKDEKGHYIMIREAMRDCNGTDNTQE